VKNDEEILRLVKIEAMDDAEARPQRAVMSPARVVAPMSVK